jgi:preprotein translocase subunit YajC
MRRTVTRDLEGWACSRALGGFLRADHCAVEAESMGVRRQQLSPAITPDPRLGLIVAPGRAPDIPGARRPGGKPQVEGWMSSMGSSLQLILLPLFFVLLYFVMIAPQQKKQKKWQQMLTQLKNGDRVTTNGGIRGVIVSVKDDAVLLRIAPDNIKLEFVKSAIAAVTTPDE